MAAAAPPEHSRLRRWTVTGLKIFFGLPLSHNVDLEEIDPYK